MKKLLLLVAIAALSVSAFAATENLSFGGSAEFQGVYVFQDKAPDTHYTQSEIYLWASADLADNVMAKVNIKYRNVFGGEPTGLTDANTGGDLNLQEGYVKLGKIWESPVTIVIGRWVNQKPNEEGITSAGNRSNLVPFYGEGFIIPNNNSVDGAKATYDGGNWCLDALWFKNVKGLATDNHDNTLYGVYGVYNGWEKQKVDAYLLWDDAANAASHGQTFVIGARGEGKITAVDGLGYKAELAWTDTHNTSPLTGDPNGFGGYAGVNYLFSNVQYTPAAHLNVYYLEHNFTQPYGHVDQDDLGEWAYGAVVDAGTNLTGVTNANGALGANGFYFFNLGATIKPADKWSVDGDYYHYNNSWGNSALGHEVDLRLSYQYSENVAAELIGGYYIAPKNLTGATSAALLGFPGDAYLLRGGLKVTF